MHGIVTQPHQSNYPIPIILNEGDLVILGELDTEFDGWIRVTVNNHQGWAPVQYIRLTENGTQGIAKCHYNARELNTQLSEMLSLKQELNGWFWAENSHGDAGWVPAKTIKII